MRDSITAEGLPYASLSAGRGVTSVADARGIFELAIPAGCDSLRAYSQGYAPRTIPLGTNSFGLYDIYLVPQATELDEVVVKKKKYSKRNNPAVEFARRLRRAGAATDPLRKPFYSYDSYDRIAIGFSNFNPDSASALMRRFPFLAQHTDSSEISGTPVLMLALKETSSTVGHRLSPSAEKRQIHGTLRQGVDQFVDQDNVQTVLDDLLREVDLYDSDIHLLRNTFVSPLSAVAPDFYRFYLVDTVMVDNQKCVSLAFYPRNKSSFGFMGHVYVAADDTLMSVRKVDMRVADDINLNFIRRLGITQNYDTAPDGTRLKTLDKIVLEMQLVPGTPEVYISRRTSLRGHSFEPLDSSFYDRSGTVFADPEAESRDSSFWAEARHIPRRYGESRTDELRDRLRKAPLYYWGEKLLGYMFKGYVGTSDPSRFDIGPINTLASYNSLEGLRLRAGGMTTANLSRRWFGRGYVAYGFRDHRWKYGLEAEYSFNDKKYHSREFPVHSLRLTHSYDIEDRKSVV